jgi:acyl-CoA thioester hydrolase
MNITIPVRFRDTDAMGHVNNAVYMTYLEVIRERYWRDVLGIDDYRKCGMILARTEIDFRSPAVVGETLQVSARVSRLGRTSFDFTYEIREKRSSRLIVEAVSVQVMYDYERGAKRPLTEQERETMLAFEGEIGP